MAVIDAVESAGQLGVGQDLTGFPMITEYRFFPELHADLKSGRHWEEQVEPQWVRVKSIVDSGAVQSIALPSMAPGVPVEESYMSKAGGSYISANNHRIPNMGQQAVNVVTNEGGNGT